MLRVIAPFAAAATAATVLLALPGAADSKDDDPRYALVRRHAVGEVHRVKTLKRTLYDVRYKGVHGVVGGQELKEERREYREEVTEVRADGAVVMRRHYELATRIKKHPTAKEAETIKTILHGRDVVVTLQPSGNRSFVLVGGGADLEDDDRDDTAEQIAYAALSGKPVAVGDEWDIDGAVLGKAVFGQGYTPSLFSTGGKAKFRAIKRVGGVECARVKLATKMRITQTETLPAVRLDLAGELLFDPAAGRVVRFELAGPAFWAAKKQEEDGTMADVRAEGRTAYSYVSEPVEDEGD